jgi:hypothetical protein
VYDAFSGYRIWNSHVCGVVGVSGTSAIVVLCFPLFRRGRFLDWTELLEIALVQFIEELATLVGRLDCLP